MAITPIDYGTISGDGTGETLLSGYDKAYANDQSLDTDITTLIADRVIAYSTCAQILEQNVYPFPNGSTFQIIDNAAAQMDFTVTAPYNFYITYGSAIHLVTPLGLDPEIHQTGWIVTRGAITNWDDIFIHDEYQYKPIDDISYSVLSLYEYFVVSSNFIAIKKSPLEYSAIDEGSYPELIGESNCLANKAQKTADLALQRVLHLENVVAAIEARVTALEP